MPNTNTNVKPTVNMKSVISFLDENRKDLLYGGMMIVLLVRVMIYLVHFFPGFGEFTWSKIEQKELYVQRILDELKKAKKKPEMYQSLKYYDIAILILFAWFLFFTEKSQFIAFLKLAIGMTLLNYA